jgi:uncharacterized membrane protein
MLIVILGFILMSGSGSTEEQFNPEIFSATRIRVAPLVSLAGFVLIMVAIMYRSKSSQKSVEEKQDNIDTTAQQS